MTTDKTPGGLFGQLYTAIKAVDAEYAKLSKRQQQLLGERGFRKADLASLNRIADERIGPVVGNVAPEKKGKGPAVDPAQMTIFDFGA